eukprot:COSAG01_NODE_38908_length_483_cov_3.703125_1_plen_21_part_10
MDTLHVYMTLHVTEIYYSTAF